MNSGIYQIKNTINGNCYIGSAVDFKKRWVVHLSTLRHKYHYNSHLQAAFSKYGEKALIFEILEDVEPENLIEREQYYLDTLKPEYNISPTAGNLLGYKHRDEVMRKRSKAMKGRSHPHKSHRLSEDTKSKIRKARIGQQASEETKQKLMGRQVSEDTRQKISRALTGLHRSEETKQKIRMARTGKHLNEDTKQKLSRANKGKHLSEQTKQKLSEAMMGNQNRWKNVDFSST